MEIYLDNSATTMAYPECGELLYSVMTKEYGNPSSLHRKGMEAEKIVKTAAKRIADTIKVSDREIYFLSPFHALSFFILHIKIITKQDRHQ